MYETGVEIAAADISVAANGNIQVTADIDFGTADEAVGTVTHVSSIGAPTRSDSERSQAPLSALATRF